MPALGPREVVIVSVGRRSNRGRPKREEACGEARAKEKEERRPADQIGCDIDPEIGWSDFIQRCGRCETVDTIADGGNPRFVQKRGSEDVGVIDVSRIDPDETGDIVAAHVGAVEGAGGVAVVSGESRRQSVAAGNRIIELAKILIVVGDS